MRHMQVSLVENVYLWFLYVRTFGGLFPCRSQLLDEVCLDMQLVLLVRPLLPRLSLDQEYLLQGLKMTQGEADLQQAFMDALVMPGENPVLNTRLEQTFIENPVLKLGHQIFTCILQWTLVLIVEAGNLENICLLDLWIYSLPRKSTLNMTFTLLCLKCKELSLLKFKKFSPRLMNCQLE